MNAACLSSVPLSVGLLSDDAFLEWDLFADPLMLEGVLGR